jgi:hypothetical protein
MAKKLRGKREMAKELRRKRDQDPTSHYPPLERLYIPSTLFNSPGTTPCYVAYLETTVLSNILVIYHRNDIVLMTVVKII